MLVAITRILNEDDIVEAFVRHTLAFADQMVLLDNGSTDGTIDILRALHAEGAPILVLQAPSTVSNEQEACTALYHFTNRRFAPDWLLCLDADEFIDARGIDLRAALAATPPARQSVTMPLRNYYAGSADQTDLLTPRRMRLRDASQTGVVKCFVRGRLQGDVVVLAGNHGAMIGGVAASSHAIAGLGLAHFPFRYAAQGTLKAVIGRLKVMAAGGGDALVSQVASHYIAPWEILCRDPASLLRNPGYMQGSLPPLPMVEDPIAYRGGPLRYTVATDQEMKAVRGLLAAAGAIAASHGRLLDSDPAARDRMFDEALQITRII